MKPLALAALLTLVPLLASCGSDGPCKSGRNGTYGGANGELLTVDESCGFSYAASSCSSSGTYSALTADSGTTKISITQTSGGSGCLPAGSYDCQYGFSGSAATLNCGTGTQIFTKK